MKKKISLSKLEVQSFVTNNEKAPLKGGGFTAPDLNSNCCSSQVRQCYKSDCYWDCA